MDAQVNRLARMSVAARNASRMLVLTRLIFSALDKHGLQPVLGQRAVCSRASRVGTACDLICFDSKRGCLVIVELKTGFSGCKFSAASSNGVACKMKAGLTSAVDCIFHRHCAQLAVTHAFFCRETTTLKLLQGVGIDSVRALLLYANDEELEFHFLDDWWHKRASRVIKALASER